MKPRTREFHDSARRAIENPALRRAIATANESYMHSRANAVAGLPEWNELRDRAAFVKDEALDRLGEHLAALEERIEARGGAVHWAEDGAAACGIVLEIARKAGARSAVKSKSMVTEEIGLNAALEGAGIDVVESDLGEYIVQLAGETPSHIITPAIHKSRGEIAKLLHEKIGTRAGADIPEMTRGAREVLREKFLRADLGVSGVNFAVAETGTLVIVENEGNARLSTTLPRVHVAIMGIEKVVPRAADLAVLLRLLCRSATGQSITTYVSFIGGPRPPGAADGPKELHLVILDGGRSRLWSDRRMRSALRCIRCGACLNFCPVYERIGGHAYGWVYPGPIGSVITPGLAGMDEARDLPHASSLCGRCGEVCPVKIPLPQLLVANRAREAEAGRPGPPWSDRLAMKLFAWVVGSPARYRIAAGLLRWFLRPILGARPAARMFGPLRAWTRARNLPRPAAESFHARWRRDPAQRAGGKLP